MSEKETERLEREREKKERARARLEAEREKLEQARERLEEERERLEEESERIGEEVAEKVARAVSKIDVKADAIDKAMEHIQDRIENGIAGIDIDIRKDDDVVKNLGVLNMKDITDEELGKIKGIKNLGVIIVPEELMSKVSAKITKNLGTIVPYKKGWRLYSGHTIINAAMLQALDEPLEFLQTGHLEFDEDVTAQMVKEKVKAFHNYGHVQATEQTYGVLMAKCLENYGHVSKNGDEEDEDDD